MKLKAAKILLENKIAELINMSDFVLRSNEDHNYIIQVKLGGDVNEVAQSFADSLALKGV